VHLLPKTELLNETQFFDLDHARTAIALWAADYNESRPHSALGYIPPTAYAANLSATRGRPGNPDQPSRPRIAPPAPDSVKLICSLKTGPFRVRVFRGKFPLAGRSGKR